ncbi:unnamed protein product [Rotaria sordida]|nr:unnamed protein product [Rotaria sordida]CAF1387887.1 unnamed protein product [Rotaria sordida]
MGNAANENCNETTMSKLGDIMKRISSYAGAYKMMHEVEQEEINRAKREKRAPPPLRMIFDINHRIHDRRLYSLPTANEVAAVFVGEDSGVPTYRHIAIHPRGQGLQTIQIIDPNCDPMTYPLLFPRGDKGWYLELEKIDQSRNRRRVSMLQFYSYRLAIHPTFSAIHYREKLFQQYIVDGYVKTEQNRLAFHRQNQKALRVELYQDLMNHLANEAEIEGLRPGRVIILPSSFQGSPRAMQQNYQDAMTIGHDCANIKLQRPVQEGAAADQGTLEWDEIKAHLDARYVSAPEAAWRLFEFPLHDKSHAIVRLAVHLPNQQPVYFAEGNERQALERAAMKDTTLTAWFKLNSKDPDARQYLYHDIPQYFVFERNGTW